MPKMRKKADLPQKLCPVCGRPFTWRKRWRLMWNEVKFCSQRCKDEARRQPPAGRP